MLQKVFHCFFFGNPYWRKIAWNNVRTEATEAFSQIWKSTSLFRGDSISTKLEEKKIVTFSSLLVNFFLFERDVYELFLQETQPRALRTSL